MAWLVTPLQEDNAQAGRAEPSMRHARLLLSTYHKERKVIDSDPDTGESGEERQSSADVGLKANAALTGSRALLPHCDLTVCCEAREETAAETKAGKGGNRRLPMDLEPRSRAPSV